VGRCGASAPWSRMPSACVHHCVIVCGQCHEQPPTFPICCVCVVVSDPPSVKEISAGGWDVLGRAVGPQEPFLFSSPKKKKQSHHTHTYMHGTDDEDDETVDAIRRSLALLLSFPSIHPSHIRGRGLACSTSAWYWGLTLAVASARPPSMTQRRTRGCRTRCTTARQAAWRACRRFVVVVVVVVVGWNVCVYVYVVMGWFGWLGECGWA
jgi:hypothetical protein